MDLTLGLHVRRLIAATGMALMSLVFSCVVRADPISGEVAVSTEGGFARLVFKLDEEVATKVSMSGAVLIIEFQKPVAVSVERISSRAPDYFSAARLDPDGSAVRIALARKVKINTITAAERFYVDLLPENWVGLPPGLPQEVINELAKRARDAEQLVRKQQLAAKPSVNAPIRVKVGVQPTFIRYIFEMPDLANVVPERTPGKLTLNFDQPLQFDLADAKATLPASLERIDSERDRDSAVVTFRLKGKPLIRSYRDGHSIIIDIGVPLSNKRASARPTATDPAKKPPDGAISAPETVLANGAPDQRSHAGTPAGSLVGEQMPSEAPPKDKIPAIAAPDSKAPQAAELASPPRAPSKAEEAVQKPNTQPAIRTDNAAAASASAEPAKVSGAGKTHTAATEPLEAVPSEPPSPSAPPVPPELFSSQKKAAPSAQPKPETAAVTPPVVDPNAPVKVAVHRQGGNLRIDFPFAAPTPAAVFMRGRAIWLVFDSAAKVDVSALSAESWIGTPTVRHGDDGEILLQLPIEQLKLASFFSEGSGWVLTIGDSVVEPTRPVTIARSIVGKGRASITIPFVDPRKLHRISDPQVGDQLLIVTALGPARGFLKEQDFVELRALSSTHGVVINPLADDVIAELSGDKIVISRPGGLSLSSSAIASRDNNNNPTSQPLMFDTQTWGFDRQAKFEERQSELLTRAAAAPEAKRQIARLDLARFYLARDMGAEAKGVLDVVTADDHADDDVTGSVLKAVANVMLRRPEDALKELANPKIGDNADAPIWRAMAHALLGQWAKAREEFKNVEIAVGALPVELQREVKGEWLRCTVETRDFAGASSLLNDFETLGVPPQMAPAMQVLTGRVEEGLGHTTDALNAYRLAASSPDRRYAVKGELREILLRHRLGDLKHQDVIDQLEQLTTAWRGDETEAEGLRLLAHLYTQDKRYRDAFHVMRTALLAHPDSDLTRKIQDEAAATFDSLFLSNESDRMPAIEALGLFYDYRELTPIGRRGDEMIRRLADRLVSVDLLDQAAELLQHQVDHRLQGAARAQVATRLATIYLTNHKADKALAVLQTTRLSEITNDLRDQRLLLEARAMSDVGRHGLALEVIEGMKGREALRLRADILWAGKKWREAAEAVELLYADRWSQPAPLNDQERRDVLRGAIAYALAEEPMGLKRFRDKYHAKMVDSPDRQAFEVVSAPIGSSAKEFRAVAAAIGGLDTLDAFLKEMRARYPDKEQVAGTPDTSAPETKPAPPLAKTEQAQPENKGAGSKMPSESTPAAAPAKPDRTPTGSIPVWSRAR
jgi:tetratricopeptide (TPR) repeat protein